MSEIRSAAFDELDVRTLYALMKLRVDAFVVEQHCAYPELDDLDQVAQHFWVDGDNGPVAYLRVLDESDATARIGRVVVDPSHRGSGLAGTLMAAALDTIGERQCVLNAQSHLTEFYSRYGFVATGPEFLEDGIAHVPMRR